MNKQGKATVAAAIAGILVIAGAGVGVSTLAGCGTNCRETVRMADFEQSQGNLERAEKLYEEALEQDPAACADARDKLENARLLRR